jgi:hypothetical protein
MTGAYQGTSGDQLEDQARFAFSSKYTKGQTTPSGTTQFTFKAASLTFSSNSYDWLVVTGVTDNGCAKFKGHGLINNDRITDYQFILTACDKATDTFRIKIWKSDSTVVYDNASCTDAEICGTNLQSGAITIKTDKAGKSMLF